MRSELREKSPSPRLGHKDLEIISVQKEVVLCEEYYLLRLPSIGRKYSKQARVVSYSLLATVTKYHKLRSL